MNINIAMKEAAKARHRQHKFGAVLFRGGRVLQSSHNFSHIHAEHAVLNRAWRQDVDGATILVIRMRKNGTLGLAKPCKLCMKRLAQAGVKKVIYSNNFGQLETFKLSSKDSSDVYLEYHFIKSRGKTTHEY